MRSSATLFLAAVLAAGAGHAQPFAFDLGEIVVSANRSATERARTGVSVSTLPGRALADAPGGEAAQALARLPGIAYTTTGPIGSTGTLQIRGADSRYIVTVFEGIRLDDPSGTQVAFNFGMLPGPGLGRAEVLRGSQSAVWGGSAVGGVVSLEGPRADRDGLAQAATVEGGGYGTLAGSYALTWRRPGAELAFGLAHLRTDGFSAAAAGTEPDGAQITRATLTGRYALSDAVTLGFALIGQTARQDYDGFDPVTFALVDQANRQDRTEAGARIYAEIAAGRTRHTLEATGYTVDRAFDQAGTIDRFAGSRIGLAWRAETTATDRLTLLYGLDWTEERAVYDKLPGGRAASALTGGFAQALWAPRDDLDLSLAARLDHDSRFGTFPTGRVALAWRPDADTVVRAALANGFRAPSIDERFGVYPGAFPFVGNPALTPERSVSAEVGVERRFAGGARVQATAFLLDTDNLITYQFGIPTSTLVNLPGVSTRRGVEVGLDLPLGRRLGLEAAYTWTDALRANGTRIDLVPRHALAATLNAEITGRLRASLSLRHLADRGASFGTPAADVTVLDATLRLALTDRAEAYLRVENLGDAVYELVPGYGTGRRTVHVGLAARF